MTEEPTTATEEVAEPKTSKPAQTRLDLGAPPRFSFAVMDVEKIWRTNLGAPPSEELIRSVEALGVLEPIIVREGENGYAFEIIDGRRRFVAAERAGVSEIPALVLESGDPSLMGGSIPLATNDAREPNPIIEFEAIEDLMRSRPGIGLPAIANELGVTLKTLRKRMKIANVRHELRDAARASKFGAKVLEKIAPLTAEAQSELLRRLEANGTITIADIRDVKRIGVRTHERLPATDRKYARAREELERVRKDLFLDLGDKHPVMEALADAIAELRELE